MPSPLPGAPEQGPGSACFQFEQGAFVAQHRSQQLLQHVLYEHPCQSEKVLAISCKRLASRTVVCCSQHARLQVVNGTEQGAWFKISMAFVLDHVNERTNIHDVMGDRSALDYLERNNKVKTRNFAHSRIAVM
jgi:hypothetical protein